MPKEKNSADSAIASAVRAARGSSIIVPNGNFERAAVGVGDGLQDAGGLVTNQLELLDAADERDHDLRLRVALHPLPEAGRLGDGPHLQARTGPG